jgi:4-hydroxy-tetrahydrodipicolinate reductase
MRLALIGNGKMGRAIAAVAGERGHTVVTIVEQEENPGGAALTPERLAGVDVAFEFTQPDAAMANLLALARVAIPTVTGTTGWAADLPTIAEAVESKGGALLHSPNFSVGVQLFLRAARDLATRMAPHAEYQAYILEEHHAAKLDAPSGTALRLRDGVARADPGREFPVSSVRAGVIPGTHTLAYDTADETIQLVHIARSRHAFAAGALQAGAWLIGRRGVFTFEEMLFGRNS